ncbi:MAG: MFS transporter [Azonexus sp.]
MANRGTDANQRRRMAWQRWTSYSLLILVYMLGYFHRMAPAVLSGELQADFHASGAALGILAASYFYAYAAMQIPAGILADFWGTRRIVALGCLTAGIGTLCFGGANTLWAAALGRFLLGMGVSVVFVAILKLTSQWFYDRQFATMTGLTIFLGNIGGLTAATPLAWALEVSSWRSIVIFLGVVSLLASAIISYVVKDSPADAGFPSMRALEGKSDHLTAPATWQGALMTVLKNRATWPGFFASMGLGGTFFTLAGLWAVPYLRDVQQFDYAMTSNHAALLLIGFAIGSILVGMLSDYLGRRRPVMIAFILAFAVCWLPVQFAFTLPLWASLTNYFLLGLFATGYTISLTATKELNAPALSGMATGVINTGTFLGAAILQPLIGIIMDMTCDGATGKSGAPIYSVTNYQSAFATMSIFVLLSLVAAMLIRETYCRPSQA